MCTTTGLQVTTGSANFYIAERERLQCFIDHNGFIRPEHHVKHVHISSLNDVALEAGERSVGHLLMARCTLLGCADDEHIVCG